MRRLVIPFTTVLAAITLMMAAPTANATSAKTLTFEVDLTSQGTTLHNLPGDIVYGWNHLAGSTTWGRRSAELEFLGSVNYVDGNGPFGGMVTVTKSNGAQLAFSVSGWATSPANQKGTANARFTGSLEVIGGAGAYDGATGTGTMSGYRKAALGSPVHLVFSVTVAQAPGK